MKNLSRLLFACLILTVAACQSGVSSYADAPMNGVAPVATAAAPIAPVEPAAPAKSTSNSADYMCGDQRVTFVLDEQMGAKMGNLQIANTAYAMQQVIAASGTKYENLGDASTVFWSKGPQAMLKVRGQDYPQCAQVPPLKKEKAQSPDGVRNITWVLEDINNTGIIDNSHVTLILDPKGRVYGSAGCNSYSGEYELQDQKLTVGPNLVTTMMACAATAMMEQEVRYTNLLPQMTKIQLLKTGALVLMANDGRLLRFMPEG